jgi:hypothetical protein
MGWDTKEISPPAQRHTTTAWNLICEGSETDVILVPGDRRLESAASARVSNGTTSEASAGGETREYTRKVFSDGCVRNVPALSEPYKDFSKGHC